MEPQQNTGSFGAAIGGAGSALQEAMNRRGMSAGVLSQQSPASASFEPGMLPVDVPQDAGAAVPTPQPQQESTGAGAAPGSFEAEIILKALDSRLKTLSKIDEANSIQPKPQIPGGI